MASSASPSDRDQSPPTPEVSDSFFDDDGDSQADEEEEEDDEEEAEVEEDGGDGGEEEEEEEEKEEEEKEVEEIESDSPEKAVDGYNREDAREDVKSQRGDGRFRPGSSNREEFGLGVTFAQNVKSKEFVVDKKEAGTLSEKSSSIHCKNPNSDGNADLSDKQLLNAKTSNASNADGNEMVAAMRTNNFFEPNDVLQSHGEIKQMGMRSGDDRKRMASRLVSSGTETRSLLPGAEIKDQNKRPAIICDFYAKGWCIKGTSCRFLHVKEHQKRDLSQHEGDVAADYKREVQLEGLNETTERARSPSDPLAASVGNKSVFSSHLSSQRIKPWEHIESKILHHLPEIPKFPSLQRDESFPLSFKDVGNESKRKNGSPNDYGDHASLTNRDDALLRDRRFPEYTVSSSHQFVNPSSHSRGTGELVSIQSQWPYNYMPLSPSSHPPNSSSSNSLLATGTVSSNLVSAWRGSSLLFSSSSLSASHLASSSSSLLQSSSHFSGSGLDNLTSAKRKVSLNDWEPSVPFQPSFLLRSLIACPGSQYDPLRDSVELPKVGDISLRASLHSQGSSVLNTSHQQNNGDVVSDTRGRSGYDDTMSVSSHNTNHGKDMQTTEVEAVRTSTDRKHRNVSKQGNSLGSSAVKDMSGATSDVRHQRHGPRDIVDAKVDGFRQKNKMDAANIVEGGTHVESKALRQFRAALIDLVKESLKPKWREGLLRKDAHNKIVKKAVEKVLSTMQSEQIPTSTELVMQYLASSRPKIDKLVEGYIEIYGKL